MGTKCWYSCVGNWQLGGSYSYFQGAPLAWGNLIYLGGALNYHANIANTASFNTVGVQHRFQPAAFQ